MSPNGGTGAQILELHMNRYLMMIGYSFPTANTIRMIRSNKKMGKFVRYIYIKK